MYITKIIIHNFKGFKHFEMDFSDNVNVIVGNNNEGKSTIFEAIHLALTASVNGKNVLVDIPAYIFNSTAVNEYLAKVRAGKVVVPPQAYIELFFLKKLKIIIMWEIIILKQRRVPALKYSLN